MSECRLVLGIESSCDETAAAVVQNGRRVLSNVVASQNELHAEYRGVVPEIASRAHAERIGTVMRASLKQAGVEPADLAAVAVGHRPGLIGSLLVGVSAAKAAAWGLGVPLVGVDHVRAHLYAGVLHEGAEDGAAEPDLSGSALGLVVSGGHTAFYKVESWQRITRLGGTIDDAIGEAYDKVAAMLNLPFPGGPVVDRLAADGDEKRFAFPISRLDKASLNLSYSGLKTAVLYTLRGVPDAEDRPAMEINPPNIADLCASFQRAAVAAVILKLERALDQHPAVRTLLTGGGVTANSRLRRELTALGERRGVRVLLPRMAYCVDNGAMIAGLGHRLLSERGWQGDPLSLAAQPSGTPETIP